MPTLIQQLNQTRSDRSNVLSEGRRRLERLQSRRTGESLERQQREAELQSLRDSRVTNPRQTANNFAQLLNNDGGFGAAIAFGITSAQADFADTVEARIEDARLQLQELRQRELDESQQQQIEFGQQLQVNAAASAEAGAAVSDAQADVERADALLQQGIVNERAERQLTLQENQFSENVRSNRRREAREDVADQIAQTDRAIALSERISQVQSDIDQLNPDVSETDKQLEREAVQRTFDAFDNADEIGIIDSLLGGTQAGRDRAVNAKILVENGDQFIQTIKSFKRQNSKEVLADALTGRIDPAIRDIRQIVNNALIRDPRDESGVAKRFRDQISTLSILKARIADEVESGNQNDNAVQQLRDREALLQAALQVTKRQAEQLAQ